MVRQRKIFFSFLNVENWESIVNGCFWFTILRSEIKRFLQIHQAKLN